MNTLHKASLETNVAKLQPRSEGTLLKSFFKQLSFKTDKNNIAELQADLAQYIKDDDYFFIRDLTEESCKWVEESQIENGILTLQVLHTTCTVGINETNEPCLLVDFVEKLRQLAPKDAPYHHNSPHRVANRCDMDKKCDTNGEAHTRAFMFGSPSVSIIVNEGRPVFGTWQRLHFIDLDGPRNRQCAIQIIGC